MSKLRDILKRMQVEEYGTVPMQDTEAAIKQLFLELIDEVQPSKSFDLVHSHTDILNTLSELRAKIQDL